MTNEPDKIDGARQVQDLSFDELLTAVMQRVNEHNARTCAGEFDNAIAISLVYQKFYSGKESKPDGKCTTFIAGTDFAIGRVMAQQVFCVRDREVLNLSFMHTLSQMLDNADEVDRTHKCLFRREIKRK